MIMKWLYIEEPVQMQVDLDRFWILQCLPGAGLEHYMFSTGYRYFFQKYLMNLFKSCNGLSEENPAPAPNTREKHPKVL